MDEYLYYLTAIKNVSYSNPGPSSEVTNQSYNSNYKKTSLNNNIPKKRKVVVEKKDYKDLDDPDNTVNSNRNLISYDDL